MSWLGTQHHPLFLKMSQYITCFSIKQPCEPSGLLIFRRTLKISMRQSSPKLWCWPLEPNKSSPGIHHVLSGRWLHNCDVLCKWLQSTEWYFQAQLNCYLLTPCTLFEVIFLSIGLLKLFLCNTLNNFLLLMVSWHL